MQNSKSITVSGAADCDACRARPHAIYGSLVPTCVQKIAETRAEVRIVSARNAILWEEARAETERVYVVREGWACHSLLSPRGRRQVVAILLPGDLINWFALCGGARRGTYWALTDLMLCAFDRKSLAALLSKPQFAGTETMECCEQNIGMLFDRIAELGVHSAIERVAALIHDLHRRLAARGLVHEGSFEFPLTFGLIGEYAGVSVAHVSRIFRELSENGIIEMGDKRLRVLDEGRLREFASLP